MPAVPLVTLHTAGDEVVPVWHELRDALKRAPESRRRVSLLTPAGHGHCALGLRDVLVALGILLRRAGAP